MTMTALIKDSSAAHRLSAMRPTLAVLTAAAVVSLAGGCGSGDSDGPEALPQGDEPVQLKPDDFTTQVDNPYFPIAPGSRWVYRETDTEGARQRVVVTVLERTRVVAGIRARVVHDVVTEDGALVENTFDWYAQDTDGNVWYLGEDTKEFENGKMAGTEGSWEAGVEGAQAGIIMPAHPEVGMTYRQEYYKGEAEDAAKVLSIDERVEVPYGSFEGAVMTKDYTPLEPDLIEYKFYARGVGLVLAVAISGGSDREELMTFTKPS
jgi:hypothetical protein